LIARFVAVMETPRRNPRIRRIVVQVQELMTANVTCVGPDATLRQAAQTMRDLDVGSLPVCDNERLTGIVTDRDIAIRAVAQSDDPAQCKVRDIMSEAIEYCFQDDNVEDATQLMKDKQIRRLAVLDHDKRLVGILALGDVATRARDDAEVGETLEEISEPGRAR
jgi:CBS domain-containing protein